jgi:cytochrome c
VKRPVLLILCAAGMLIAGCAMSSPGAPASQRSVQDAMRQYGCPACHQIPGVAGATGQVGPSLEGVRRRSYVAGAVPNTPDNLAAWIMHPQHLRPGTAMPEMGVTELDAHRIAEFLEKNH